MRTLVVRNSSVFGAERMTESGPFSLRQRISGAVSVIRDAWMPHTLRTWGRNEFCHINIKKEIKIRFWYFEAE